MTVESVYGEVIDCKTSPWSSWSECTKTCGREMKEKSRQILVHPQNGGKPCPQKLLKRRKCKIPSCDNTRKNSKETLPSWGGVFHYGDYEKLDERENKNCILSEWSQWSPCSASCGINAVKQRTKDIIQAPGIFGQPCPPRIETKACNLLPCKY